MFVIHTDASCPTSPERYRNLPGDIKAAVRQRYSTVAPNRFRNIMVTGVALFLLSVGLATTGPVPFLGHGVAYGIGCTIVLALIMFSVPALLIMIGPANGHAIELAWTAMLNGVLDDMPAQELYAIIPHPSEAEVELTALRNQWLAAHVTDPEAYLILAKDSQLTALELADAVQMLLTPAPTSA